MALSLNNFQIIAILKGKPREAEMVFITSEFAIDNLSENLVFDI